MMGGHLILLKIEINLDIIDILILCEDLGSMETPKPMGGCMGWWVEGGGSNLWGHDKSLK